MDDKYRFFVPDLREQAGQGGGLVRLPEDQGHHAKGVLRLGTGERVAVFDGKGWHGAGEIRVKGKEMVVMVGEFVNDMPPAVKLVLATAVPKGERADWLVEQASQLNVGKVQWVMCERGVVKPREGGGKMEKWRKLAVESAKQCGRNYVMEVGEGVDVAAVLAAGVKIFWMDAHGGEGARALSGLMGEVTVLVGPEGGWSDGERRILEAAIETGRVTRVRLMETVLRVETACAAVAAVVMGTMRE